MSDHCLTWPLLSFAKLEDVLVVASGDPALKNSFR